MPKRIDRLIAAMLTAEPNTHIVFSDAITPDSYALNAEHEVTVLYVHPSHRAAVEGHQTWGRSESIGSDNGRHVPAPYKTSPGRYPGQ